MADETGVQFNSTSVSITALVRATQSSFDIIVPLSTTKSNHTDVQLILCKVRKGGNNYIASVSESFNTAKSGFAFATRAQDLCTALARGRDDCSDELIHDSIAEMREIAQNAHAEAKATTQMFNANRREFTQIRFSATETFKSIETKRRQVIANGEKAESKALSWKREVPVVGSVVAKVFKSKAKGHAKKAISYEQALQSLEPAGKDLKQLMVEMDIVTGYWMGIDIELEDRGPSQEAPRRPYASNED